MLTVFEEIVPRLVGASLSAERASALFDRFERASPVFTMLAQRDLLPLEPADAPADWSEATPDPIDWLWHGNLTSGSDLADRVAAVAGHRAQLVRDAARPKVLTKDGRAPRRNQGKVMRYLILVFSIACAGSDPGVPHAASEEGGTSGNDESSPEPVVPGPATSAEPTTSAAAAPVRPRPVSPEATDITLPSSVLPPDHPAWIAWRNALALRLEPPEDSSVATLDAWTSVLHSWQAKRTELRHLVATEFMTALGNGTDIRTEYEAAIGLLLEDVARAFLAFPVPEDRLEEGSGARRHFLAIFWDLTVPILRGADDFYRTCAERAGSDPEWIRLCESRRASLRESIEGPILLFDELSPRRQAVVLALMDQLRAARMR